jgi:hypothetical protein
MKAPEGGNLHEVDFRLLIDDELLATFSIPRFAGYRAFAPCRDKILSPVRWPTESDPRSEMPYRPGIALVAPRGRFLAHSYFMAPDWPTHRTPDQIDKPGRGGSSPDQK